jgi:hypothetical protein
MYIDDPFAHALGIAPSTDQPTIKQLLEEHPPTSKGITSPNKGNRYTIKNRRGAKPSEQHKANLRAAMLRREQDPAWIARKAEMRAKMAASKIGNKNRLGGNKIKQAPERLTYSEI